MQRWGLAGANSPQTSLYPLARSRPIRSACQVECCMRSTHFRTIDRVSLSFHRIGMLYRVQQPHSSGLHMRGKPPWRGSWDLVSARIAYALRILIGIKHGGQRHDSAKSRLIAVLTGRTDPSHLVHPTSSPTLTLNKRFMCISTKSMARPNS